MKAHITAAKVRRDEQKASELKMTHLPFCLPFFSIAFTDGSIVSTLDTQ